MTYAELLSKLYELSPSQLRQTVTISTYLKELLAAYANHRRLARTLAAIDAPRAQYEDEKRWNFVKYPSGAIPSTINGAGWVEYEGFDR